MSACGREDAFAAEEYGGSGEGIGCGNVLPNSPVRDRESGESADIGERGRWRSGSGVDDGGAVAAEPEVSEGDADEDRQGNEGGLGCDGAEG